MATKYGKRKICWPDPDQVCLEGGCTWCVDGRWIQYDTLLRLAKGKDRHQGGSAWERAYRYGEHSPNIEHRDPQP